MNSKTFYVNSWTDEEDLILVDLVLRYIRTGNSLSSAYEEAANTLPGRTISSCKNQWMGRLSKVYEFALEEARHQRSVLLENTDPQDIKKPTQNPSLDVMKQAIGKALISRVEPSASESESTTTALLEQLPTPLDDANNPFVRIRKFVRKIEREYGPMMTEHAQLQNQVDSLTAQLASTQEQNAEYEKQVRFLHTNLDNAVAHASELHNKLAEANQHMQSFSQIKELLVEFNNIH